MIAVVAHIADLPTIAVERIQDQIKIPDIKEAIVHPEAIPQEVTLEDQDPEVILPEADLSHRAVLVADHTLQAVPVADHHQVALAEVPHHEGEVIREDISTA